MVDCVGWLRRHTTACLADAPSKSMATKRSRPNPCCQHLLGVRDLRHRLNRIDHSDLFTDRSGDHQRVARRADGDGPSRSVSAGVPRFSESLRDAPRHSTASSCIDRRNQPIEPVASIPTTTGGGIDP